MSCDKKIGPFDCCSVVQGDCLELMQELPFLGVAVITDPPYGINYRPDYGNRKMPNGSTMFRTSMPAVIGDDKDFDPSPWLGFASVLLWGVDHYADRMPRDGQWLVWDKRCGIVPPRCQGDAEFAWINNHGQSRIFRHLWDGMVRASEHGQPRLHPTQKPVEVMEWCIGFFPDAAIILDPYCGSGSTLVAAKKLGRHFLGFEISEQYCKIARDRLARIEAQPQLFAPKAEHAVSSRLAGPESCPRAQRKRI